MSVDKQAHKKEDPHGSTCLYMDPANNWDSSSRVVLAELKGCWVCIEW